MGYPTDETDQLWEGLYDSTEPTALASFALTLTPITVIAIFKISEEEAKLLPHPTLPIPGTKDYLIQLDVFHELHCLNDLRMLLYPERFPGLEELKDENGVIDREDQAFRHWSTCLTALGHLPGEIIRTAGFDQAPDEDIEDQYKFFPGDAFFRYWRERPEEAEHLFFIEALRDASKSITCLHLSSECYWFLQTIINITGFLLPFSANTGMDIRAPYHKQADDLFVFSLGGGVDRIEANVVRDLRINAGVKKLCDHLGAAIHYGQVSCSALLAIWVVGVNVVVEKKLDHFEVAAFCAET
ncbi:hypothetical protein DL770_010280 [Monosporascus sp. CRB-9-2]|nr:hypothetical protein DL770_010280 [Monosporascus sp. CRB-9-2]